MSLERRLGEMEARRAELEDEISYRQVELVGVRAQIEAIRGRLAAEAGGSAAVSRTDRVRRILELAQHPLSPADIVGALAEGGDETSARDVRGTLAHLKREGHVLNVARGQWAASYRSA